MCESIRFNKGPDIGTIRKFQERFSVDAKEYGWDGNEDFLDCCLCDIDLKRFFREHPEYKFYYESGEWWSAMAYL